MKKTAFTCQRDGLTIKGMQYVPADFDPSKQYPAIIFSHGYTGNGSHMEPLCTDFAAMGYVTFAFHFCGGGWIGESEELKSDGKTTDMSILTEVADLTAVLEYVRALPFVDNEEIILAGSSQGGFVSGVTAARHPDWVSKLVMLYPALCIPDHARRGCMGGGHYDPANVPEEIDCGRSILGRAFHEEMAAMDPYLELAAYKGPVLILHGTEDRVVNCAYSVRAKEEYEKGQCHLQIIRNMGHAMNPSQHESAVASIRQFLRGRREILTIRILLTHCESETAGNVEKKALYFTGYCENELFQGTVLPGGCDHQTYVDGVQTQIRAEYTLDGLDAAGKHCTLHIVNQRGKEDFEPVIHTESEALRWLNDARLTAVIEGGNGGPTIRIYADGKSK